jgi:ppGpp synthetase/RelA/SpoT-type nucleotidyltranferase
MGSIYGEYKTTLEHIKNEIVEKLLAYQDSMTSEDGEKGFEHISARVKSEESMREKCIRTELPETPESALFVLKDAIGIRVVCSFLDDIYGVVEYIRSLVNCEIIEEKDYIKHAKQNGYRSYHMILRYRGYFIEIQLRTISMDTWAALEHQMKYKKKVNGNVELISSCSISFCFSTIDFICFSICY